MDREHVELDPLGEATERTDHLTQHVAGASERTCQLQRRRNGQPMLEQAITDIGERLDQPGELGGVAAFAIGPAERRPQLSVDGGMLRTIRPPPLTLSQHRRPLSSQLPLTPLNDTQPGIERIVTQTDNITHDIPELNTPIDHTHIVVEHVFDRNA